jgi:hypothetical protein
MSDELIVEQKVPVSANEQLMKEKAEEKIAEKKEDLAKQEAEIKKDEVLVNKEPSAVLNNAEQPAKPEVKAN